LKNSDGPFVVDPRRLMQPDKGILRRMAMAGRGRAYRMRLQVAKGELQAVCLMRRLCIPEVCLVDGLEFIPSEAVKVLEINCERKNT